MFSAPIATFTAVLLGQRTILSRTHSCLGGEYLTIWSFFKDDQPGTDWRLLHFSFLFPPYKFVGAILLSFLLLFSPASS